MKLNLTSYLITALILCAFYSCKKDNEVEKVKKITYSEDLYRVSIVKNAELKMYTNGVQITDNIIIDKYIKQYSQYFNLDKTPLETELRMRFISADSAVFEKALGRYRYANTNGKYIFTGKEDINRPGNLPLFVNMFKYSMPYVPYNISPTQTQYRTKDVRVGYGNAIEMSLPVMSYQVSSRPSSSFYYRASGISFNEFDETVLSKMGANDTLAIQLFTYIMKAKVIE
jgi:hypothetical protein